MIDDVRVVWALIADSAVVGDGGKLSIHGVFDFIMAKTFPARHEKLALVFKLECSAAEYDQVKNLKICLLEADGKHVLDLEAELHIKRPPSILLGIQQIIEIEGIVFPKAGDYRFEILIDNDSKAHLPIRLVAGQANANIAGTRKAGD